jgi:hypothetical protein
MAQGECTDGTDVALLGTQRTHWGKESSSRHRDSYHWEEDSSLAHKGQAVATQRDKIENEYS